MNSMNEPLSAAPASIADIRALRDRGEITRAIETTEHSLPLLPASARGPMLLMSSQLHATAGNALEALRAAVAAHEVSQAAGDEIEACRALTALAGALRLAGDHASAIRTLEQAETLVRGLEAPLELSAVLRTMAISSSIIGRHQHALSCMAEASQLLGRHGTPADAMSVRMSMLNARSRHADSLETAEREAGLLSLLGEWQQLAEDARAAGQRLTEVKAEGNFAIELSMLGRHADAARALAALRPQYAALGLRPNEGLCLGELARCQLALGDAAAARDSALQAVALLDGGGAVDDLREAFEQLSAAHEALGDHAAALAALRRVLELQRRQRDDEARAAVLQRELRIELARLTDQWARHATQDPLTGLANRRALDQWLGQQLPRVEQGQPLVLLLMDLDHFKSVNDGFGHAIGDLVLQRVAELLRPLCRDADLAVRYGGEEFLLALSGVAIPDALRVAERVRAVIAGQPWGEVAPGLAVTVSVGLASALEVGDAQALFTLADRRLYAAKLGGRDRVVAAG